MKALFLDIDGVCNSATYAHAIGIGGMLGIDPVPAALVRRIVQETGCVVVLSSTWRLHEGNRETVRREVCDFIDVTPYMAGTADRGCEVAAWLEAHPDIERYAILDDDSDFHHDQPLFSTSWQDGLTEPIAKKVIAYLNAA